MSEPPAPPRSMLAQRLLEALAEMVVYFAGRLHCVRFLPSLSLGGGGGAWLLRPRRRRRSLFSQTPDLGVRFTQSATALVPPTTRACTQTQEHGAVRGPRRSTDRHKHRQMHVRVRSARACRHR